MYSEEKFNEKVKEWLLEDGYVNLTEDWSQCKHSKDDSLVTIRVSFLQKFSIENIKLSEKIEVSADVNDEEKAMRLAVIKLNRILVKKRENMYNL